MIFYRVCGRRVELFKAVFCESTIRIINEGIDRTMVARLIWVEESYAWIVGIHRTCDEIIDSVLVGGIPTCNLPISL